MWRYIAKRLLQLIPVFLIVYTIVFFIMHALPGDPAMLMLAGAEGGAISPERIEILREQMGLNEPLIVQYTRYLGNILFKADFGNSIRLRSPVRDLILSMFGSTISLSLVGLGFSIIIGTGLGIMAALRQNSWWDTLTTVMSYIGVSMPVFWLGLLLIFFFSFQLGWFPSAGGEGFKSLILPGFTLGFASAGVVSRLTRSSLIEILNEDYIRTARAKGLKNSKVILNHAVKNALIPVITMIGLQFGSMLAGAVVTETVFSRPGLGRLVVNAILWKDYPLIQGIVLFMAAMYLLVNLLVDVSYAYLDPRIRFD
jgi:ABC-type dipeptide/oligopeptide/nickel transport system permease component